MRDKPKNALYVMTVPIRGCTLSTNRGYGFDRQGLWARVWKCADPCRAGSEGFHNTYMELKSDKGNPHDADAIEMLAKGECFGCMGYVGREYTSHLRRALTMLDGKKAAMGHFWVGFSDNEASPLGNSEILVDVYLDGDRVSDRSLLDSGAFDEFRIDARSEQEQL